MWKTLRRLILVGLVAVASPPPAVSNDLTAPPAAGESSPFFKEYRYRMSAAIRPLLFWIGDGDVGAARIVWRQDKDGYRGYEFLLGSDPARAPRKINRWGWVSEQMHEGGATQMGLMRKTDEDSMEEARAQVGFEGEYVFKMIRTEIADGEARAENTVWLVKDDYTYHELGEVLRLVGEPPPSPPKINEATMPPGTHPGFLFAVADIVDKAVTAATQDPRELLRKVMRTAHVAQVQPQRHYRNDGRCGFPAGWLARRHHFQPRHRHVLGCRYRERYLLRVR